MSANPHGDARMTYPFEGVIRMETIKDENGSDKVVWKYVDNEPQIVASYEPMHTLYGSGNTMWAKVDKDLNLVHLDMDLCAKGPANTYTALGVGIWNAAIKSERNKVAQWMIERGYATGHGDTVEDLLKELEWQIRESQREASAKSIRARGNT